ncbi:MAG: hypothetical protein ACD_29C00401G0001 [uncultured bacterium]|nr:MAG: hypothetical protein ACD_29C00401G0001 [uncultured bacterium]
MNYYVFYCEDAPNSEEIRKAVRPAHLARLQVLSDTEKLLVAGPLIQENNIVFGSLIIAKFENLDQAKEWIAADPFVAVAVYQNITVKLFRQAEFT